MRYRRTFRLPLYVVLASIAFLVPAWRSGQPVAAAGPEAVHAAAPATTLTLNAFEDSWIDAGNADTTHGSEFSLEVGRVLGRTANYDHQALVRFDLSALPADAIVFQARLQVYQHASQGAEDSYGIWPDAISVRWTEADVTWTNIWTNKPGATNMGDGPVYLNLTTGWKELSVTNIVQYWAGHRDQNYGILLRGDGSTLATLTIRSGIRPGCAR